MREPLEKIIDAIIDSWKKMPSVVQRELDGFLSKLTTRKWYQKGDPVDPGLIEVAIAVAALWIALPPSLVSPDADPVIVDGLKKVVFVGVAFSTFTSITLLNLYVRGRGSRSRQILLSPIEDGPFFLLGWVITVVFLIGAIFPFMKS